MPNGLPGWPLVSRHSSSIFSVQKARSNLVLCNLTKLKNMLWNFIRFFIVTVRIEIEKVFFITSWHEKMCWLCECHFSYIEHQIWYNLIQIRGFQIPKDFYSVLKVQELSICFSIFIFWKNLRTIGLRTSIKLSDEFHKSLKKSKQTQMTGPTTTFIIFWDFLLF